MGDDSERIKIRQAMKASLQSYYAERRRNSISKKRSYSEMDDNYNNKQQSSSSAKKRKIARRAPRIYSYKMVWDGGSAPNPYGQVLSLALCKPQIRKHAECGDWIIGFGAKTYAQSDKLIYCFKVDKKLTFDTYYRLCSRKDHLSVKFKKENGDCIYFMDTQTKEMKRRHGGVHDSDYHQRKDLGVVHGGSFVLLSRKYDFYYFGDKALKLPNHLKKLLPTSRNYQWKRQSDCISEFEAWIQTKEKGKSGNPNY